MFLKIFLFFIPVYLLAGEVVWDNDSNEKYGDIYREIHPEIKKSTVLKENSTTIITSNKPVKLDLYDAKQYCKNLKLHGIRGWELIELSTLKYQSSFSILNYGYYWLSDPSGGYDNTGMIVGINGKAFRSSIYEKQYVACQRDLYTYLRLEHGKNISDIVDITNYYLFRSLKNNKLNKSKYEKKSTFEKRIKKNQKLIQKLTLKSVSNAYGTLYGKPYLENNIKYNPENETFYGVIKSTNGGFEEQVSISVPIKEAESFERDIKKLNTKVVFDYKDEKLILKNIVIQRAKNRYIAQLTDINYNDDNAVMTANLSSLEVIAKVLPKQNNINNDDISMFLADSKGGKIHNNRWLFIIAIENYEFTDSVIYSENSAKQIKNVMKNRLGIPEKNVRTLINEGATSAKINYRLADMLKRVKAGDTIYFYYSGHGIPVPSQHNTPYMLAQDMNPAYLVDDRFKLQNIYKRLSNSKASKIIAFVDSCFSGGTDNQALIKGVAATRIKPKKVTFDKNKMVVISAGSGTQYSNKYDAKSNRLFSYYVMRGLIKNNTDTQRLYDYVKSNVQEKSYEMGSSYEQVPVYDGNIKLGL